jgi:hypothetical protein
MTNIGYLENQEPILGIFRGKFELCKLKPLKSKDCVLAVDVHPSDGPLSAQTTSRLSGKIASVSAVRHHAMRGGISFCQ